MVCLKKIALLSCLFLSTGFLSLAQKPKSESELDELKGRVKKVSEEMANLVNKDGKWIASKKQMASVTTYDAQGKNLLRQRYDYRGNLDETATWLDIDGNRAIKMERIEHDYDPPPMAAPPGVQSKKRDPRYDLLYVDKYDGEGNRIERLVLDNDGSVTSLRISKFDSKRSEIASEHYTSHEAMKHFQRMTVYPRPKPINKDRIRSVKLPNGKTEEVVFTSKTTYQADEKGNRVESVHYDEEGNISSRTKYDDYGFDRRGNWIKRTIYNIETKDGKDITKPVAIQYRSIIYHQGK